MATMATRFATIVSVDVSTGELKYSRVFAVRLVDEDFMAVSYLFPSHFAPYPLVDLLWACTQSQIEGSALVPKTTMRYALQS